MSTHANAIIETVKAMAILDRCEELFTAHGIDVSRPAPLEVTMSYLDCQIVAKGSDSALDVTIETPSENLLSILRQEFIERVAEVDQELASTVRWSGDMNIGGRPANFRVLRVKSRRLVMEGMARVTLEGTDVEALDRDGIHVKLMKPLHAVREPKWPILEANGSTTWPTGEDELHARFVTLRHLRTDMREIDIDIAIHNGGLISDWASNPSIGDEVGIIGPGGDPELPVTDGVMLAADRTGLPAIARLLESVNGEATGLIVAEAANIDELKSYLPDTTMRLAAFDRQSFHENVIREAREMSSLHTVNYAWFAGEFETAQAFRKHFKVDMGLTKHQQFSVAYWRRDVPGHTSREL